nr:DUF3052 domain-containing protein [Allomuricauda sp.]
MKQTSGYSNTPLAKKLGIKNGFKVFLYNEPSHYIGLFSDLPDDLSYADTIAKETIDFIHIFCTSRSELEKYAQMAKPGLKKTGLMWISWPKGSSNIPTDLKREPVREYMLSIGLVDIKVTAVDQDWSGLKFVYRTKDR